MKLFITSDIYVVDYCREMFQFDLSSAILKKRSDKFDSVSLNWHYTELKTSVQEQHKLAYAALAPHSAIRFLTSNYICIYENGGNRS